MLKNYIVSSALAAKPLRRDADGAVVGREVCLVDEGNVDRIEQIKAENQSFKRGFEQALNVEYGWPISARAVELARGERKSADVDNAEDIFKADIDLIISHANEIFNEQALEAFLKPSLPADRARLIVSGGREQRERFDRIYDATYHNEELEFMYYLSPADAHNETLIDQFKAHFISLPSFKTAKLGSLALTAHVVPAVRLFASACRASCLYGFWLIRDHLPFDVIRRIFAVIVYRVPPPPP